MVELVTEVETGPGLAEMAFLQLLRRERDPLEAETVTEVGDDVFDVGVEHGLVSGERIDEPDS